MPLSVAATAPVVVSRLTSIALLLAVCSRAWPHRCRLGARQKCRGTGLAAAFLGQNLHSQNVQVMRLSARWSLRSPALRRCFGPDALYPANELLPHRTPPQRPRTPGGKWSVSKRGTEPPGPLGKRVGLFPGSKSFRHRLLSKVNLVELPKATLIFNYAINVCLPPGSHYAGSYCGALALNSLQIS